MLPSGGGPLTHDEVRRAHESLVGAGWQHAPSPHGADFYTHPDHYGHKVQLDQQGATHTLIHPWSEDAQV